MALILINISELVQPQSKEIQNLSPVDIIHDAALYIKNGFVVAAGPESEIRKNYPIDSTTEWLDIGGRAVIPGLVDSHTHVVFAGERIDEFSRRARGETYEEIAKAGGGIIRSIEPLRQRPETEIINESKNRMQLLLKHGTTTCEIKSGYGMSPSAELKQLKIIDALRSDTPIDIMPTVLAHVIPPEFQQKRDVYIKQFQREVIGIAAQTNLAKFCDVFVEQTAFQDDEARQLLNFAAKLKLKVKCHVDQLHNNRGAQLAAELGAISADHLECTDNKGFQALAEARVMATILPGCTLFLGKGPWPNGRAMRDNDCEVAIATDCNPGSSMLFDLALCGTLAATHCGLTLEESLWGITRGGAKALALNDRGRLMPNERGDFVILDHSDWRSLFYRPGDAPIYAVGIKGEIVYQAESSYSLL